MKVGSGGINALQKAFGFLKGMLDYEKSLGRTSMKKLLMKGGDLQILQFKSEDMKKVEKLAKKYGILYSVLPDVNKKDGLSEVIFHAEAVPRANMIIQKLKFGRIATFDDYLKNGDEKDLGKLMEFLKGQQRGEPGKTGNEFPGKLHTEKTSRAEVLMEGLIEKVGLYAMEKQSISVEAVRENFSIGNEQAENIIKQLETIGVLEKGDVKGEHKVIMNKESFQNRIRGYQDLAERMRVVSASKDMSLADVTISKKLIVTENERAVKTRIPGAWGRFIWINKENAMDIHNGKTLLTFLDRNKNYKIYDDENRLVETMKGSQLYASHYDKVETTVRERYEKSREQAKAPKPVSERKKR